MTITTAHAKFRDREHEDTGALQDVTRPDALQRHSLLSLTQEGCERCLDELCQRCSLSSSPHSTPSDSLGRLYLHDGTGCQDLLFNVGITG